MARKKEADVTHVLSTKTAIGKEDKRFYRIVNLILGLLVVTVLFPIVNVLACSFSSGDAIVSGKVLLWPVEATLENYKAVFKEQDILTGYANTIFYTVVGTAINIVMTLLAAYPLSRRNLAGKNVIMMLFAFTMLFNGGLIPNYLLMKSLGILNTRWVMVLPGAIAVYNMVICRTFFATSLPEELWEAAQVDGCTDFKYFLKVALPLSKAVIAVIGLYYAVAHWNAYFNAFLYLNKSSLYPLQIVLKEILISNTVDPNTILDADSASSLNMVEGLKYACILVACVPVWCIYPFIQKYFVQGVMIGAIKG